jgi:DNA-binding NtrC family response regulator
MARPQKLEGFPPLAEVRNRYVRSVLVAARFNMKLAARTLGVDRRTLYREISTTPELAVLMRRFRMEQLEGRAA